MSKNLGELQQLIMLAVIRLGDDAYGSRIREELLAVAGRKLSISAIYVTLVRLEKDGLVASNDGARPPHGGRPRRCFQVTPPGLRELRAAREAANKMWAGVEGGIGIGLVVVLALATQVMLLAVPTL